ncbi:uncharacterized protein LOC126563124 [Anopheles maculipalpis]|uniref:uncharacterized protein LOC126563124 n=1 Tax=Anopheles maculipalpis TaxID=1496333 RepID=UPI0021591D47|nr:uncharacterized protein LOC126563124 [Anopheles maculipalpis]
MATLENVHLFEFVAHSTENLNGGRGPKRERRAFVNIRNHVFFLVVSQLVLLCVVGCWMV